MRIFSFFSFIKIRKPGLMATMSTFCSAFLFKARFEAWSCNSQLLLNVQLRPVLGLQCSNSREASLTKVWCCKGSRMPTALCPKSGCCLSTLSQNSLSVCDVNLSLNVESDIMSMNWSSSAELKPVGAYALKGSLTQSYWELFSGKYFLKYPISDEIYLMCGITEMAS